MSQYRYLTTDVITGRVLADTIPLHVSSFSRGLGGVGQPGTLSGYLDLGVLGAAKQATFLGALEPRRTMLWALQDNAPVWGGVLWDWPMTSIQQSQLPVSGKEIGSLFAKRQIRTDQIYTGVDVLDVVRNLLSYALAKGNGSVGNLVIDMSSSRALAGTTVSVVFAASNLPKVSAAVDQFCAQNNVEYAFTPGWNAGMTAPIVTLQLGSPYLKRPYSATNLQFVYPSQYVLDYGFPRAGSGSVNSLLATATSAGSIPWQSGAAHGLNSADLASGYPLLEDSVSYTAAAVTAQAQIDGYADGQVARMSGSTTVPSVTVGGGGIPTAGQVQLGDEAMLVATSPYHPADSTTGAPGLQQLVRIIGWTVTPADQQPEQTVFAFGGVTT